MSEQSQDKNIELSQPKWPVEDNLVPLYANQFSIVRTSNEFIIVFGEFNPTEFAGRSVPEIKNYLSSALVKPISKIIMSPAGAKALYTIMKDSLKGLADVEQGEV